jgi:hypothetical protein
MEKYVVLLGVCLLTGLLLLALVGHVVKMWRKARKEKKDMGRLKAGSVWRMRLRTLRNNPFDENARYLVTVLETKVNSDGRMWVKYLHKSGFVETDPADMFVQMYIYVEGPVYATVGGEVLRKDEE